MTKIISVLLAVLIFRPAFAAEAVPVSLPTVVGPEQDADSDRTQAYATAAITAAVIASVITYVAKDQRSTLNPKPTRNAVRVYIDQSARIGIALDL